MRERSLRLSAAAARDIRRHGEETYPHECCGALVGVAGCVTATVPLPNTTEDGPRRRFLVRPSDYRLAEQRATELGGELLGFYHSHPDHPARPSQYDLDHAGLLPSCSAAAPWPRCCPPGRRDRRSIRAGTSLRHAPGWRARLPPSP